MEDALNRLLNAGAEDVRSIWADAWRQQGKKVVGVLDSLVPEEVIYAAGMLPWRVRGVWNKDVSRAMVYRLPHGNTFLHHVMESLLEGRLDLLDGVVCSARDEDFLRFADYWEHLSHVPLIDIVEVPVVDSETTQRRLAGKIRAFAVKVGELAGVEVTDDSLREAIAVYDKSRSLLKEVYSLRKADEPPLSGGECLALTAAAMVMPRDEFNRALEEELPRLRSRKATSATTRPRVMISSDLLDDRAFLDLVEETGCLVAMDDLDTGRRYFWELVGEGTGDPYAALAKRYLKNESPRMFDWRTQAGHLMELAGEYAIDGVIELPDMYDYPRGFRKIHMERWFKDAGIPWASFERGYLLGNVGQLKTRVEAFLEMLDGDGLD